MAARYKKRRLNRYHRLVSEGFSRAESQVLSQFLFKQPYIRLMRRERRVLVRHTMRARGIPYRQITKLFKRFTLSRRGRSLLKREVESLYNMYGWMDAYAMMRFYRQKAIDLGMYFPPPKKKREYSKGDVIEQRKRYKAKQKPIPKQIGEVIFNPETQRFEPRFY